MEYLNPYIELCLEGSFSVFKGLNQRDKEALVRQHTLTIIKKGRFLFKQGEKPRGLICLASGKAKVYKEGVGGRGQILKMVRQQGFIGDVGQPLETFLDGDRIEVPALECLE